MEQDQVMPSPAGTIKNFGNLVIRVLSVDVHKAKKYLEHQFGGRESVIFSGTLPVRLAIRLLGFAIQEGSGFEEATA